jgi:uncharacterized membrane protein YbaN (DUF454 family)
MTITTERAAVVRPILASLGVLCIALGVIGVFVPGLPTTEFVLGASYLFARSSPRLERWLESNRWFGPSLRRFRETRGMPRRAKMLALTSMWIGLSVSIYVLASVGVGAQIAAAALGMIGTGTILFLVRTTAGRQSLILS